MEVNSQKEINIVNVEKMRAYSKREREMDCQFRDRKKSNCEKE